MTVSPALSTPEGPFRLADLVDDERRTAITQALDGVRWEMALRPGYQPGQAFCFLQHRAFPDDVFLGLRAWQSPINTQLLDSGAVLTVTVEPKFDNVKKRWGFAVKAEDHLIIAAGSTDTTPAPDNAAIASEKARAADTQSCLDKIRYLASWGNSDGSEQTRNIAAHCLDLDPSSQPRIDQAIKKGQEDGQLLKPFYRFGTRLGARLSKDREFQQTLQKLEQTHPNLVNRARESAMKGAKATARAAESRLLERSGLPVTKICPPQLAQTPQAAPLPAPTRTPLPAAVAATDLHPRDLRALAPAPAWRFLIDETGTVFGPEANQLRSGDRGLGRFLGLLMPRDGSELKPLPPGWHAVDQTISEIDRVIQAILDAPVGVLGITVQQLPDAAGERWAFGVIRLLDLVLRLLPIDGPTRLEVLIEQRGDDFRGGTQWPAVAEQARLRLAEAYPERGRLIELQIRTIRKKDSPFNGYVDALAFIASGSSQHPAPAWPPLDWPAPVCWAAMPRP